MATLYTDLLLVRLLQDVEKWYNEHYFPKGYIGHKGIITYHKGVIQKYYDPNDKREAHIIREELLTKAQDIVNGGQLQYEE